MEKIRAKITLHPYNADRKALIIGCFFCWENIMSMRTEAPREQKAFYNSSVWNQCRLSYISKVGGLCERCKSQGIIKPGYIVHHKIYITPENMQNPDVLLNHDNLEYLCQDCHNAEHKKKIKRFVVDEDGKIFARR